MSSLNWKNIKIGLCPKCSNTLKMVGLLEAEYKCSAVMTCDFRMGDAAYQRLIISMQESKEENAE